MTAPTVRPLQVWTHAAEPSRRFLVLSVRTGHAHGWDYHQHKAATYNKALPVADLVARYRLVEDTPAHLVAQVEDRQVTS